MLPRTLPTDIDGLNLVLGGGIPVVARGGAAPSAVILIRGAPGVGKTAFGTQTAASLARSLAVDVAYCCVELLPEELAAQHAGFMRGQPEVVVPFPIAGKIPQDTCRIFAAILPLGEPPGAEALRPALEKLRDDIATYGGKPRVVVVDSLSAGYGLGPDTRREIVDEVCKFAAAEGLILFLLEEAVDDRPSTWSFAADIVLSLGLNEGDRTPAMPEPYERRLTVIKNRFGPSDPGPHAFTLAPSEGVFVMPRPTAYLRPSLQGGDWLAPQSHQLPYGPWPKGTRPGWPSVRDSAVLVYGGFTHITYCAAAVFGKPPAGSSAGVDILVQLGHASTAALPSGLQAVVLIDFADPYLSQNAFLARVLVALRRRPVQRVFVGDLAALKLFRDSTGLMRSMVVLRNILKRMQIPCIFIENGPQQPLPELANFVDVLARINPHSSNATISLAGGTPGDGVNFEFPLS